MTNDDHDEIDFDDDGSAETEASEDGHHQLRVFRDLTLPDGMARLDQVVAAIESSMRAPWSRAAKVRRDSSRARG
jgi:hypothetical protein